MYLSFSISENPGILKGQHEFFEENFYFQNSRRRKGQSIDLYCKLNKISRLNSGNIRIFKIAKSNSQGIGRKLLRYPESIVKKLMPIPYPGIQLVD